MGSPVTALDLTQQTIGAALERNWPEVNRLLALREPLLVPGLHKQPGAVEWLPKLMAAQEELVGLVTAAREAAWKRWLASTRGRDGASAYLDVAQADRGGDL